jgi:hypothetical protein
MMKIDSSRPDLRAAIERLTGEPGRSAGTTPATAGTDTVTLSPTLRKLAGAVRLSDTAEVRPDAVARGRALLAGGQLGSDLDALAQALIDAHGAAD